MKVLLLQAFFRCDVIVIVAIGYKPRQNNKCKARRILNPSCLRKNCKYLPSIVTLQVLICLAPTSPPNERTFQIDNCTNAPKCYFHLKNQWIDDIVKKIVRTVDRIPCVTSNVLNFIQIANKSTAMKLQLNEGTAICLPES